MKLAICFGLLTLSVLVAGAGCSHLELTPPGNNSPVRVVTGAVLTRSTLPAGTEVIVRVVDTLQAVPKPLPPQRALVDDRPSIDKRLVWDTEMVRANKLENVLGRDSQILKTQTNAPVPFRIEFSADDQELGRGLNIEARVSYGGKVRFRTVYQHVVTLETLSKQHEISTEALDGAPSRP